ncbi:MAG TPA: hypothetical protein VF275_10880 [Gammaproteobacteria bacterium]
MTENHDMYQAGDAAANHGEQRVWLIITYALHLFGAVLAVPSIIGLVMNYVLRDSAVAELRSHHDWMIRTFWWALAWTVVTWILWITLLGIPLAIMMGFAIWVWWIYRHVRGLIVLSDRMPMPY